MSWRRFVRGEGAAGKFWEIEVEGTSHTVRFGKIDMPGQTKVKKLGSAKEAHEAAEALIWKKRAEGYAEVGAAPAAAAAPLKAKTDSSSSSSPSKTTATRVTLAGPPGHVEFVLSIFDVRLVTNETPQTFDSAAAAQEHFDRFVNARKKEGYSVAKSEEISPEDMEPKTEDEAAVGGAGVIDGHRLTVEKRWTLTFVGQDEVAKAACTKIIARIEKDAPKCVQLICDFSSPGPTWAAAISKSKLPSTESFIFDTHFQTQTRQSTNTIGDLAATLQALGNVTRFFATGDLAFSPCSHASLRELYLLGDPITPELLEALGESEFPRLERLVMSLASDAGPGPDGAAVRALLGLRAPKLKAIYIDSLEDVAGTLSALGDANLRPSWKILSLAGSLDEDDLLATLEEQASAFASLDELALPFVDEMSSEAEDAARKHVPKVRDRNEDGSLSLPEIYTDW